MSVSLGPIIFQVRALATARDRYQRALGVAPSVDTPYYVGFDLPTGVHVGLEPVSSVPAGPCVYWDVTDLDGQVRRLSEDGFSVVRKPSDVGGGKRVAVLADDDGNRIGLQEVGA